MQASVQGFAREPFGRAIEVFADNLASGADVGASFAATVQGETVVDLWGGWADEARSRPWRRDTLVNVYSTTKTMTALTALLVADRGELDFNAPVARYWPEFAANGKQAITVAQVMAHTSGLSGWAEPIALAELYDWEKATALLAAQAPLWEPGTAPGYHAITQGYLIGEIVRRITSCSLGTLFRDEIAEPLGADFHIGLSPEHDARVADLIPPGDAATVPEGKPGPLVLNIMHNPATHPFDTHTRAWRAAEIPASNGHGHARAVAEILAVLANAGAAKGRRILSEATCRKALEPQIAGLDLILGVPARYCLGFGLSPMIPLPSDASVFWGGLGGSLIIVDMDARATYAYAMNKMGRKILGDARGLDLAQSVWSQLRGHLELSKSGRNKEGSA